MRSILIACLLLAGASAHACELTAGPGGVIRYSEGQTGGVATIGCIFGEKWELRAYWVGEQRIYNDTVRIDAFPALAASRVWMFRDGHKFRPIFTVGLLLKESQRCHFDGDLDCNRQVPLPVSFHFSAGFKWGDVSVTLEHNSDSSLDYGPEKKTLGLDLLRGEVWF